MADCNIVIFEDTRYEQLLPLVYWRSCSELRCGAYTLYERIGKALNAETLMFFVRSELANATAERNIGPVCTQAPTDKPTLFINARSLLFESFPLPTENTIFVRDDDVAAIWACPDLAAQITRDLFFQTHKLGMILASVPRVDAPWLLMHYPWDMVHQTTKAIAYDWQDFATGGVQGTVHSGAHLLNENSIAIGPNSVIKPGAVLDADDGPIIIGDHVTIKANSVIEGPVYIGDGCLVQPTSVIREGTTLGPVCKVGGEIECSIVQGYANKQHDGFLGHSYIGSWVNIAADVITSDLKNTYGPVRVPINGQMVDSGQMFVGLTMGDHAKVAINSKFGTGSVVGFAANVLVSEFPPSFVPSFSWLTDAGLSAAHPDKMLDIARRVMARRKIDLTPTLEKLFLGVCHRAPSIERPA